MDVNLLAKEIEACEKKGKLPKAVIPTDLYGQCADLGQILEICEPYGIPVIADSAEALGSTYWSKQNGVRSKQRKDKMKISERGQDLNISSGPERKGGDSSKWVHAGVGAKAAVFSFNGNKIITTSGGGMLVSDDDRLIEQARFLSQQARDQAPHYEHTQIGYNYRMSNVLAAIGRGQLKVLDERVEAKRWIFDYYKEALGDLSRVEFMPEAPYGRSNRWLTVVLITPDEFGADREAVRLALETKNIEARPVWKPMHLQPVFDTGRKAQGERQKARNEKKRYRARVIGGQVAEDLFDRGLCLPSGTAMTGADLDRVISLIRKCKR
jgi:dTDP-4-amino-4,6-dideoxygalactose transaminase